MKLRDKNLLTDHLHKFIVTYENSLDAGVCDQLVTLFEQQTPEFIDNQQTPQFSQWNFTAEMTKDEDLHKHLVKTAMKYRDEYYEEMCRDCFPEKHQWEQFRIKKYRSGTDDQFKTHVDVGDYSSARRYLAMFWYLNDVVEGGETEFLHKKIVPTKGTLVMFPPFWCFPHKALPCVSSDKYILTTYLHYK